MPYLVEVIKRLKMMGYEPGRDFLDPKAKMVTVYLKGFDAASEKPLWVKIKREDLINNPYSLEYVASLFNDMLKEELK